MLNYHKRTNKLQHSFKFKVTKQKIIYGLIACVTIKLKLSYEGFDQ